LTQAVSTFKGGSLEAFERNQVMVKPPVGDGCYIRNERRLAVREAQLQMIVEGTFLQAGIGQLDSYEVIAREVAGRPAPYRMSDAIFQEYLRERKH
jgi:hypothetical protein